MIYRCREDQRREAVLRHPSLNGIDFLEVGAKGTLAVHFLKPLQAGQVTRERLRIEGGERIRGIRILEEPKIDRGGRVLSVRVDREGDFSTYTLRLVHGPEIDAPPERFTFAEAADSAGVVRAPEGFDPLLAAIEFSFKIDCPSDFDCKPEPAPPAPSPPAPPIDYLAKDYASFRRVMLDRLAVLVPGWQGQSPADLGIMLVEMLGYVADRLSYEQDAVATEAYLGTARHRVSVRRHARLLDDTLFEGANARVWVRIGLAPGVEEALLRARTELGPTQFLTRVAGLDAVIAPGSEAHDLALAERPVVFELMEDVRLFAAHAEIPFYTFGAMECCLPAGATRATLKGSLPGLRRGTVLVLVERVGPRTGRPEDADPLHRHPVRLVEDARNGSDPLTGEAIAEIAWHAEDALPFDLCLSSRRDPTQGGGLVLDVAVARGNIALADHGRTLALPEDLGTVPAPHLSRIPAVGGPPMPVPPRFRPALKGSPLTHAAPPPFRDEGDATRPARAAFDALPSEARPQVLSLTSTLAGVTSNWRLTRDLLTDSQDRNDFVVEIEEEGRAHLRFGDGRHGRRPAPGSRFTARYRIGNGAPGNVGAESLGHIVTAETRIAGVENPLPATGGTDPEPIAAARERIPQAFRTQERAVTPADYALLARRFPGVQQAVASLRWTGSGHTVFVTVDRLGGLPVDAAFERALRAHLERFRVAGQDLEVDGPRYVPLEIELHVTVHRDHLRSDVRTALLAVFSNRTQPDGRLGVFHPDRLSFGQTVYLSPLYAAAAAIPGVGSARITTFRRQDRPGTEALTRGELALARLEIARLDNDPSFPERGVFRLAMEGGR